MQGFIDMMLQEPNRSGLEGELLSNKALELLTAIAKGEDVTEMLAAAQAAKAAQEVEADVEKLRPRPRLWPKKRPRLRLRSRWILTLRK